MAMMAAVLVGFNGCKDGPANNNDSEKENSTTTDKEPVTTQLTPEQTKERLMNIANGLIGKFNTNDQKAAIQLADGMYDKYQNYSFEVFEDEYEDRYDELFRVPQYMSGVMRGNARMANNNRAYTFSFEGESVIWEADDANRTWRNKGKSSDNSVILRAKDKNGTMCEAKFWGEGTTKTYQYSWEETHWEYPRIYMTSDIYGGYGYGYYDGAYRDFQYSTYYGWYYENEYGNRVYVSAADISSFDVYDSDYNYYYNYDAATGRYYRNDYENGYEVSDGMRTATGILPEKVHFTLKQGNTLIMQCDLRQEMVKNDHATFNIEAKVVNLRWTSDVNINSTNGSAAFAFYYDNDALFSAVAHLPSYKLIGKADSQSYEDWIQQYEDNYDDLLKKLGSADAAVDIHGLAQAKVNVSDGSVAYRDFVKLDEMTWEESRTQQGAQKYCDAINGNQTNGIYYNSEIKQAEVRMIVTSYESWRSIYDSYGNWVRDETYTAYEPKAVLFFPVDNTTYSFEEYFDRKPFTDLQYSLEDLVNAYIHLSQFLYDEVGEIEF